MAVDGLSRRVRCLFFALLFAVLFGPNPVRSARSVNSTEIDLISPVAGGRYRVNPDTGLAVVLAVQNRQAADYHNWTLSWSISSANRTYTWWGSHAWGTFSDFGTPQDLDTSFTIQDGDPVIGVSRPWLPSAMPLGEFVFEWSFSIGPWCNITDKRQTYVAGLGISTGTFNITVADDAQWPAFNPTSCASPLGQVSFSKTSAYTAGFLSPATLSCVITQSVTDTLDPCRATVGPAQAESISSIMSWSSLPGETPAPSSVNPTLSAPFRVSSGSSTSTASTTSVLLNGTPTSTNSAGRLRVDIFSFVALFGLTWILK
ncbi:hypothetical protein B0T24DRAFT_222644 [Lasiosphaeria ovina]|uniref:DUF7136 domain-containing protein n=1 Tax=Lasiosphaeria ovina TaxID=92902 RepID=A0AAE0NA99_9PEZI|nr:hypothetical protein B0T24DRAFT_222644 [Lasiosphaeria ovina]